jgi:transcriptional regulator with XRE-family HTH domain
MSRTRKTLGTVLTELRNRRGWTLKEMSEQTGIPVSTLSKVEHDRLSLTYDKLQLLGERLNIPMADLFVQQDAQGPAPVLGRRSIGTAENALRIDTENYEYYYLCTELKHKRMVPVVTHVHVKSIEEFGDYVRHPGEEFIYVVAGPLVVHTEFYDPVQLETGQSLYIDSGMGHAYVCGEGCDEAVIVGVMASSPEDISTLLPH